MSEHFDVVVVGGGAGGFGAAMGAAQSGAKTLLVERYGFLGGAATNANVPTYCGFLVAGETVEFAVRGVGGDVLDRLGRYGGTPQPHKSRSGNWIVAVDSEAVKAAQDAMAHEAGVTLHLHLLMTGAHVEGGRITRIDVADHERTFSITADQFVDASGEGDLCHHAGVAMDYPAADTPRYAATFPLRLGNMGEQPELHLAALAKSVNARLPRGCTAFVRSKSILTRLPGTDHLWWMGVDVVTDGVSTESLTLAERDCRTVSWLFMDELRRLPGFDKALLIASGPQVGIRESRHPRAVARVTGEDARIGRRRPDSVARAVWPMESHATPGKPVYAPIGGDGIMDIPLDALRAEGLGNLWLAGRLIGTDREAYGSVRVMGTGFATGHAAGVGAALAVQGRRDTDAIRDELRAQRALV